MAANFSLPTVLANLTAGNQALSLIDGDFTACYNSLVALGTYSNFFQDTGAANAYAITVSAPQTVAQSAGLPIQFKATNSNTGASTFQINALAAKNIVNPDGSTLSAGQIFAGAIVTVIYDGTSYQLQSIKTGKQPTRQVFTSGTAQTYTTPAGATRINVRMIGGGGGGGAQNTNNGANGTDTTFSTLTAAKGLGGANAGGAPGAGGASTNGDINLSGATGSQGFGNTAGTVTPAGGAGANSAFGGGGAAIVGAAGGAAIANTGGGGGGGGGNAGTAAGSGGGAGGYCEKLIIAPSSTYTYTVGAGGNGGAAGGQAGGNGAAGIIIVDEWYN